MCFEESCLRYDERVAYALRTLYAGFGYSRFKMGKFEEYELYVQNKDFLSGERMITFTDGDGTLLALKPDVTISILKNTQEGDKGLRKVYYHENVYRTGRGEAHFREIMQSGLECIGPLDDYQVFEVITLALQSLSLISEEYMLDLSHMGLISGLMEQAGVAASDYETVLAAVREKNPTALSEFCRDSGLSEEGCRLLRVLVDTYGSMKPVLDRLEPLCTATQSRAAIHELRVMERLLTAAGLSARVQLDFSVVNDMGYYNGIVFQGFINGLCDRVLSGGRYDRLAEKMGKRLGAIGFALSLNELERLSSPSVEYDVDVLLLYDEETKLAELSETVLRLRTQGKKLLVQCDRPERLSPREVMDLRGLGEKSK